MAHDGGPGVKVPPPFIYLAGFGVGWLLDRAVDLPELTGTSLTLVGVALVVAGFGLLAPSALGFRRAGTNLAPHQPTTALVLTGPYRFTRNPIYLGFALVYAGAALWAGVTGALLVLPVVLLVMDRMVIAREERYLEQKFGSQYTSFKSRVRRWL